MESEQEQIVPVEQSPALPTGQAINALHHQVIEHGTNALILAIQIGKRLSDLKKEIGHFQWIRWMADNLEFTDRTARNYMRLAKFETYLLEERVQNLNEAYVKLCPSKARQPGDKVSHLSEEQNEWLEGLAEDLFDNVQDEITDHAEEALGFVIHELKTLRKNGGREKVVPTADASSEPVSAAL